MTIQDIALKVFLSPSYFSNLFRIFTGFTAKNYLNRYRLHRAAEDLLNSKDSIIEISLSNGFSSQQAFTKSFSKMYNISPAQYRQIKPILKHFPPKNLLEDIPNMKLMDCFNDITFITKDDFYVVGVEVDINYYETDGTSPISTAWNMWNKEKLIDIIPNQVNEGITYGITHSETEKDTGKYIVCVEVSTLGNLPYGLVCQKFNGCDFAVFNTTCEIICTGDFWRTFYSSWLKNSDYELKDEPLHKTYATFNKYPAIEVYDSNFINDRSIIQIYAPVMKR